MNVLYYQNIHSLQIIMYACVYKTRKRALSKTNERQFIDYPKIDRFFEKSSQHNLKVKSQDQRKHITRVKDTTITCGAELLLALPFMIYALCTLIQLYEEERKVASRNLKLHLKQKVCTSHKTIHFIFFVYTNPKPFIKEVCKLVSPTTCSLLTNFNWLTNIHASKMQQISLKQSIK